MSLFRSIAAVAALLLSSSAFAGNYTIDPAHTSVGFGVTHMMISTVNGEFSGVTGTLNYEVGNPQSFDLVVDVDMSTVDTGNADRDGHLQAPEFLDVAAHPTMRFSASTLHIKRNGTIEVRGDLTIKGVTRPVTLSGTGLQQEVVDPWGGRRLGASVSTSIDRQEFGVTWNQTLDAGGALVGDDVSLTINVEFVAAQ